MKAHPGRAGSLAGWYQLGLKILMAVLIIPQVILLLPSTDAGLWFTYQSILEFFTLLQFGFPLTISRQVAFTFDSNSPHEDNRNDDFLQFRPGWVGVHDLLALTRIVYIGIILLCLLLLLTIGEFILPMGKLLPEVFDQAINTWYLLGIFTIFSIYSNIYQSFLEGLGQIYIAHIIRGTFFLINGFSVITCLYLTQSIVVMAASKCVCGFLEWSILKLALRLNSRESSSFTSKLDWLKLLRLMKIALPIGCINLGRAMVVAIQVPLVGFMLGAEVVSPFYVVHKIGQTLRMAATHLTQPQLPYFTRELARKHWGAARARMTRIILIVVGFSLVTQSSFYLLSPWLVEVWIGPGKYIGRTILFWLAINYFLRSSTQIWAEFTIASGYNPFVISNLLSGIINIFLCILLIDNFGILGIIWSSLLAGLATTFWYNPYHGIRLNGRLKNELET